MSLTGVRLVHVPFKGAGPAVVDLLGGRLNLMFENLPTIITHVRSGKLRLLGVGTKQRSALAPDFPTIAEEGVPGYNSATVFGVMAPAKTPRATRSITRSASPRSRRSAPRLSRASR
jgi:tripartite-type tricarboxylate transporter receptor subunit TctC